MSHRGKLIIRNLRARLRAGRIFWLALLGYLLLTLIWTFPICLQVSTHQAGDGSDGLQHIWILWWTKTALLDLHASPNQLTLLYYPHQVYSPMMFATPLIQLLALPFLLFLSPLTVYNLLFLASFILAGMSAFLLCYYLTKSPMASFVGGAIFAFAAHTNIRATTGHLTQAMTFPIVLYILALLWFMEKPGWRRAIILGFALGASLLIHVLLTALVILPFSLTALVYFFWTDRHHFLRSFPLLALAGGVALVLAVPFYMPLLRQFSSTRLNELYDLGVVRYSADLLGFFIPHSFVLDKVAVLAYPLEKIRLDSEQWTYLGVIPVALAAWGWKKERARGKFWVAQALVAFLLSLGPILLVNGNPVSVAIEGKTQNILLPYALLHNLPVFRLVRTPARAVVTIYLALAVLASMGIAHWLKGGKAWRSLLLLPVLLGTLVEYAFLFPYPTTKLYLPPFYEQVAHDPEAYAILDYPLFLDVGYRAHRPNCALVYQTIHQHPIVGGYVWRIPQEEFWWLDRLDQTIRGEGILVAPRVYLRTIGIRYVVLHKFGPIEFQRYERNQPLDDLAETEALLQTRLGTPIYEDDQIIVYETFPPEGLLVILERNWSVAEPSKHGLHLWSTGDAVLKVYAPAETQVRLDFAVASFYQDRHLHLLVNGQAVASPWTITPAGSYRQFSSPSFSLRAGENEVVFFTEEGRQRPIDVGKGADTRCLKLDFSAITLQTEEEVP